MPKEFCVKDSDGDQLCFLNALTLSCRTHGRVERKGLKVVVRVPASILAIIDLLEQLAATMLLRWVLSFLRSLMWGK